MLGNSFLLISAIYTAARAAVYSPAITTTSGVVQGRLINAGSLEAGLDVYEFIGIAYAEPPLGNRRFSKPIPKSNSPGVLMATKTPPACPQLFGSVFPQKAADIFVPMQDTSEDCLYLNLWVPSHVLDKLYLSSAMSGNIFPWSSVFNSSLSSLAVLTWFHGGNFYSGSSMMPMFNGSVLAAYNNVIVATVQFRLGALGFAYFGTDNAPGNLGLWDQLEAMKWISQNIAAFGGDSGRMTIFGSDSGSASVSYHILSPHSAGYFQRAILQSGTANAPTLSLTQQEAYDRSMLLMNSLVADFCRDLALDAPVQDKLECLRNLEADDILKYQDSVLKPDTIGSFGYYQIPFVPAVDGDFVPQNPRDIISGSGQMNSNVSILIGINKDEGSLFMISTARALQTFPTPLDPEKNVNDLAREDFVDFIREYFAFYPRNNQSTQSLIYKFIEMHYWCSDSPFNGNDVLDALSSAVGDAFISCPVWEWARSQANSSATFMYHFTHRPSTELWPKWMGVIHGDELPFVFGFPFSSFGQAALGYTAAEKLLSRRVMTYWTNFAKFGDPNKNDSGSPNGRLLPLTKWPPFDNIRRIALEISSSSATPTPQTDALLFDFKARECSFWGDVFPQIVDLVHLAKWAKNYLSGVGALSSHSPLTQLLSTEMRTFVLTTTSTSAPQTKSANLTTATTAQATSALPSTSKMRRRLGTRTRTAPAATTTVTTPPVLLFDEYYGEK